MPKSLDKMTPEELITRITQLEYGLAELEHRLDEDSEEWEAVQDAKAPGWLTVQEDRSARDTDEDW